MSRNHTKRRGTSQAGTKQKGSKSRGDFAIGLIAGAAVVALIAIAIQNGLSKQESADETQPQATAQAPPRAALPPPPANFTTAEIAATERISAEEAGRLIDEGQAVVIDVRSADGFMAGHIPGALQIPLAFVEGEIPWFPTDKKLITYCT